MTPIKIVFASWCFSLATCCPTLWIQVTKTEPSPWPELPTPKAEAPSLPTQMQSRFDVFNGGKLVRDVSGFRDAPDPRNSEYAQGNAIAVATDSLIVKYGARFPCASKTHIATLRCTTHNGPDRPDEGCTGIELSEAPSGPWLIVDGHLRKKGGGPNLYNIGVGLEGLKEGAKVDVCVDLELAGVKTLLSFVHASDVQLRDPSVVLTDRRISKRLDWFHPLSSFEYDEDLAFYNQYMFEAVVETINQAAASGGPDAPSFVIHTGDSIDSNMKSELYRFHTIIDRLRIPFFNVFGNHDVLVFGNLVPTDQYASANDKKCTRIAALIGGETWLAPDKLCVDVNVKACPTCSTAQVQFVASTEGHAATRKTFIAEHTHDQTSPVARFPGPLIDGEYCSAKDMGSKDLAIPYDTTTHAHGFDLAVETKDPKKPTEREGLGYYAFVRPLADDTGRHAVFIALDGEELRDFEGGIYGHVGHKQLEWLRKVLACAAKPEHKHDLVFVFAHQPLSILNVDKEDENDNVDDVLNKSPNVIAYLYGHHHEHAICHDKRFDTQGNRRTCAKFWEVETGSLIEFPQEVRMVRIKELGAGLGYLEVPTFGEALTDQSTQLALFVRLARRGAERDHCATANSARCSQDRRPYRTDGNDTAARLFFRMP